MTDLTPLVPAKMRYKGPTLTLTDAADAYLDANVNCPNVRSTTATSLAMVLKSVYFLRSGWFRTQRGHTFVAYHLNGKPGPVFTFMRDHDRVWVGAPGEFQLPPNYFEERLLEEVRVENS